MKIKDFEIGKKYVDKHSTIYICEEKYENCIKFKNISRKIFQYEVMILEIKEYQEPCR